jgi:hypothetical protein
MTFEQRLIDLGQFVHLLDYRLSAQWMWSGASVAHTAPVLEDLGSILTQTQMALLDLPSPFLQTTDLKTISLICNIVMSS